MKLVYNKQIWEGTFTYIEGYDEADQYINVNFEMELMFTDNHSFMGLSTDSESRELFNKPAQVRGFIDDEKISFVKDYPCAYYKDENGHIVLDRESKHPQIHYLGFWEYDKDSVIGTWEMKIHEEKYGSDYREELATGEFEMRRVK